MLITFSDFHQARCAFLTFEEFLQEAFAWYHGESDDSIWDNDIFLFAGEEKIQFCKLLAEYF